MVSRNKEGIAIKNIGVWRRRLAQMLFASFALVALAAVTPRAARAQTTVTLTPGSATNFTGQTHTVTAQVSGVCAAIGGGSDSDGEGAVCNSDADCAALDTDGPDEFCDFSGVAGLPIGIGVVSDVDTGNTGKFTTWTTVGANGQATFQYTSSTFGIDTIQGCLDTEGADEGTGTAYGDLTMCISDNVAEGDIPSNQLTKTWAGVILTPSSAYNPVGALHTVTAQVTGVCAETTSEVDSDGEGTPCTTDAQCLLLDSGGSDEACSFANVAGLPIGIGVIAGVNSGPSAPTVWANVGSDGKATFTYSSSIPGIDTLQACLDADGPVGGKNDEGTGTDQGDLALCISDNGNEPGDDTSNTVTKHWFATPTVTLTPGTAANAASPLSGPPSQHTVTATISGGKLGTCTAGANIGVACDVATVATDCGGVNPVCDVSGFTILFAVNSGPNIGDLGTATTDVTGAASKTYSDKPDGEGLDTLKSCLDVDFNTTDAGSETTAACVAESGSDGADVASNDAYKRWEGVPTLQLQNLDPFASIVMGSNQYTSNPVYNPVASTHTVLASIGTGADSDLGVCKGGFDGDSCDVNADCGLGGICDLSGYPIGFLVLTGPNAGTYKWVNTGVTGSASWTYPDTGGSGQDTIQACLDTDIGLPGSGNDEGSVAGCLADAAAAAAGTVGEGDFASNTVLKIWLARYVTGGGKVPLGIKAWDSFGGVVGQKPGSATALVGEWQQQAHSSKGGTLNCHWSMFSAFALSCSSGSCGANPDTVVFQTAGGSLACGNETVTILAPGGKPAKIKVSDPAVPANSIGTLTTISGIWKIHP